MRRLLALVSLILCGLTLSAADISGTWSAEVTLDAGSGTATFVLKQTGDALSGTYTGALGEAKVAGTVKGDQVEWTFENAEAGKVTYTGKLDGSKITGNVVYGQLGKGTFTATKK
jgi:hypothetical protein